jgi:hypothetical protein
MINNSMKLKRFEEYLLERLETTSAEKLELLELGLLEGAVVVEWELDSPRYQTFDNEPIGTITYLPNWPNRSEKYDYRIYPISFGLDLARDLKRLSAPLADRGARQADVLQDQIRFIWPHIPALIARYFSREKPVDLIRCLNTDEWRAAAQPAINNLEQ